MTVRWRGRHVFDTIKARQYEGLLNQVADGIWWVDPTNGDDNNSGLNPDVALATTAQAIVLAEADATAKGKTRGDWHIMRMPGTEIITASIAFDLHGLHLHGLSSIYGGKPEDCLYYWAAATAAGFEITKPCEIDGVEVAAVWAGTQVFDDEGCSIRLNGNAGGFAGNFCHIHHCSFPGWGEYGGIALVAGSYNLIEHCLFETGLSAGLILMGNVRNDVYNIIRNNIFDGPTYGIQGLNLGTHQGYTMLNNDFGGNMTNALVITGFGGRSTFNNNRVAIAEANAMSGNKAAAEAVGIYAAGNNYLDGDDPRS